MQLNFDVDEAKARFGHDGVICLPNVLSAEVLALAQECYEWTLAHPGPSAGSVLLGTPGTFYQAQANPAAFESYYKLIHETSIPDITRLLFSGEDGDGVHRCADDRDRCDCGPRRSLSLTRWALELRVSVRSPASAVLVLWSQFEDARQRHHRRDRLE